MSKLKHGYSSPRWSGEILDCSMPVTFDQFSRCSFNCLYCFSFFQRELKHMNNSFVNVKESYLTLPPETVNVQKVDDIFTCKLKTQFSGYIKEKRVIQWGGLSDPFDMFEKQYGIGLELLKVFLRIKYPICFSTKSTWWVQDDRYLDLFQKSKGIWNVKFSIINYNAEKAKRMELGVPSPEDRIKAMAELTHYSTGGVTLRLRPFIIGLSDIDDEYLYIISSARNAGATAVSTEFFCLEGRVYPALQKRYDKMSEIIGFDVLDFYKKNTQSASGYLRLNYKIKEKYIDKMHRLCTKIGLRFYVSDSHHKDRCHNGCCCGLDEKWNYSRGQFTEALYIARKRFEAGEGGFVSFSDISKGLQIYKAFLWRLSEGYNTSGTYQRAQAYQLTMFSYIRSIWNNLKSKKNPYNYFYGLLKPIRVDKGGDIVYQYIPYNKV